VEIYGALVAAVFAGLGIWLGLRLTRATETVVVKEVMVPAPSTFPLDEAKRESLGITPSEHAMCGKISVMLDLHVFFRKGEVPRRCRSSKP
jgi:hypothetical protein